MILTKEGIENRIKELESAIVQQGQYVQQMNNQILMFHGAKEEYMVMLKQIQESEKLEQERIDAEKKAAEDAATQGVNEVPDNLCGEENDEKQKLQQTDDEG